MAKNITFCGIMCAMSLVLLMMTNIFTFNTVFLICISTVVFPLVRIKCGLRFGFISVIVGSLLALICLPDKILVAVYAFLALYSVLKGIIEKIDRLWIEIIIKASLYFLASGSILMIFSQNVMSAFIAVGAVLFAIYDFALSIFITFARKKMRF